MHCRAGLALLAGRETVPLPFSIVSVWRGGDDHVCDVRYLGVDYGRRRVGLALSDATGTLATPWRVVPVPSPPAALRDLTALIRQLAAEDDGLAGVVIGMPRRLDGSPNEETPFVEQLAAQLRASVQLPVILQDERLSSREAESRLAVREKDWKKRKTRLDAAAAAVILQDFLDSRA